MLELPELSCGDEDEEESEVSTCLTFLSLGTFALSGSSAAFSNCWSLHFLFQSSIISIGCLSFPCLRFLVPTIDIIIFCIKPILNKYLVK